MEGALIFFIIIGALIFSDRVSRAKRKHKEALRLDDLKRASARAEFSRPPPELAREPVESRDHWETVETFSVAANLHIKYRDGAGQITDRSVRVRSVGDYTGKPTLVGQCLLRNQPRTFHLDRILECFNEDTGEVVADVYGHLEGIYEDSPAGSIDAIWDKEFEALRVLYYIAKADGRLMPREREAMASYCRSVSGDGRIDAELIRSYVDSFGTPSLNTYKIAVGRVAKRPEAEREAVRQAAQAMLAHRKKMSAVERDALDYIDERYAKETPRESH
ncbi:MAG: hypothetical protein QNL70_04760 [Pseudomonas sp.]